MKGSSVLTSIDKFFALLLGSVAYTCANCPGGGVHHIMTKLLTQLLAGVACMALVAVPAKANLITNGSFELGSFVNQGNATDVLNIGSTSITGWTVVTDQLAWIDTGNPWGLSAQDGNRFLDFTAYPAGAPFGGISQNIATVAGQQYELAFYLGNYTQRWGGPPVSILASAAGASQNFSVTTTSTASTWTPFSMTFTANAPVTTITLTGSAGFQYIGLDNVNVEGIGGSPVPEPRYYALMIIGLGILGVAVRRRSVGRDLDY